MKQVLVLIIVFCLTLYSRAQLTSIASIATNDEINVILEDTINNKIYIGGKFTQVQGQTRRYLACIDGITHTVTSWNANINSGFSNTVHALALDGNTLYFSGNFSQVNSQTRNGVAAVNTITGALQMFNPNVSGAVFSMLVDANSIFLGGNLTSVNGGNTLPGNYGVFSFNKISGVVNSLWNPKLNGNINSMVLDGNTIYLAGNINSVDGQARKHLASINKTTAIVTSWAPNPDATVKSIQIQGDTVYAFGDFNGLGSYSPTFGPFQRHVSAIHKSTGIPFFYNTNVFDGTYVNYNNVHSNTFALLKNTFIAGVSTNLYNDCVYSSRSLGGGMYGNLTLQTPTAIRYIKYLYTARNKLYASQTEEVFLSSPNNYLGIYCVYQPPSKTFLQTTTTVCAGAKNVTYKVDKNDYVNSIQWSYTGNGVSISSGISTATLNFSNVATSGTLIARFISNCNAIKDSTMQYITVNPLPTVSAGSDVTLNCYNNGASSFNGSVTTAGTTYTWTGPGSYYKTMQTTPVVLGPAGNYVLEATITNTGCKKRDTAYVFVDTLRPSVQINPLAKSVLSCATPTLTLQATSSTLGVTYQWKNNSGFSSFNPAIISTSSPVVPTSNTSYSVLVTATQNGCQTTNTITIGLDTVRPVSGLSATSSSPKITCTTTTVSINGVSNVPRARLYWNGLGLPTNAINPNTTSIPSTYTLTANDTVNGCKAYTTLTVLADTARPIINPLTPTKYRTCDTTQVTLNASSPSVNTTFAWQTPLNTFLSNPAFVSGAGKYTVIATDAVNGCIKTNTLQVVVDTITPTLTTNVDSIQLTCLLDSFLLQAFTTSTPIIYKWNGPGGFSDTQPSITVTNQGFYSISLKNTFNGCTRSKQITVTIDSIKPYIIPFQTPPAINCSYSSIELYGTTIPSNAFDMTWYKNNVLVGADTITVSLPGNYVLVAKDTSNGCQTLQNVTVDYEAILETTLNNDTSICYGGSTSFSVLPVGGTAPFMYTWSNGSTMSNNTVSPTDTTQYTVVLLDAAGCVGKDTISINVPLPLQDSIKSYQPCDPSNPLGQVQVFPYGGTLPYSFSLDGSSYQSSNVFPSLPYGNYNVFIKDNMGCSITNTTSINLNSLLPSPNFLVTTNMFKNDTFVVVDISNPRPDSAQWVFPSTCTIIDSTNLFSPVIVNSDNGSFTVQLHAFYGACELVKTKTFSVQDIDTTLATNYNNNGIQSVLVYPNPNNGQFTAEVSLYKKQTFALFIYNANGAELYRQTIYESNYFNGTITIPNPQPGSYLLKVVSEYDSKQQLIIVSP